MNRLPPNAPHVFIEGAYACYARSESILPKLQREWGDVPMKVIPEWQMRLKRMGQRCKKNGRIVPINELLARPRIDAVTQKPTGETQGTHLNLKTWNFDPRIH